MRQSDWHKGIARVCRQHSHLSRTDQCRLLSCVAQLLFQFWELLGEEHRIDLSGAYHGNNDSLLDKLEVYFHQAELGKYIPRSVIVDLEPGSVDCVRSSRIGRMFQPDNFISGQSYFLCIIHYTI